MFQRAIGASSERHAPLFEGLVALDTSHRLWARRRLTAELGSLKGLTIAVWGLTYKPGTDTLRRSEAVELCRWLVAQGARVRAHDPAVRSLPPDLSGVERVDDPIEALRGASALVVATEWPEYTKLTLERIDSMTAPEFLVLDANRFLAAAFEGKTRSRVVAVGQPSS
jgi:UDPglucose 6-dehydrogenase